MVFHSFGVVFGGFFADSECQEEAEDDFVAFLGSGGEGRAFFCQLEALVGGRVDVAFSGQALDGLGDRDRGDAEAGGDVHCPRLTGLVDEGLDEFDVVLSGLQSMVAPGALESVGSGFRQSLFDPSTYCDSDLRRAGRNLVSFSVFVFFT